MNNRQTNELHLLTEWKSNTSAHDLPLHLYELPLSNIDKRFEENGALVYQLRKLNNFQVITFSGPLVGSFKEIKQWGDYKYSSYESRPINVSASQERDLLQRLLMKQLSMGRVRGTNGLFVFDGASYTKEFSEVIVKRAIKIDVTVDQGGGIFIGFDLKHRFYPKENIFLKATNGAIVEGTEVVDTTGKHYIYKGVEKRTVGEHFKEFGQSILDYYISQGRPKEVANIPPSTPAVIVESKSKPGYPIYYAPQFLFEVCSFSQLPNSIKKQVNRYIKLNAQEKMKLSIDMTTQILMGNGYLSFGKNGLLAESLGFDVQALSPPPLLFGNGTKTSNPLQGLKTGRVYDSRSVKEITIHFFMEDSFFDSYKEKVPPSQQIRRLIEDLCSTSLGLGIKLNISPDTKNVEGYREVSFKNPTEFRMNLKRISKEFKHPVVVVARAENMDQCYRILKNECSKHNIPTQVVTLDTLNIQESGRVYALYNILLGIYAKSGVQPWILAEPLSSDVYVGLDVSHEEGRHSTGIVQVIGKDGRVLDSGPMSSSESGEKIRKESLEELVANAIFSYEQEYRIKPAHITFHRDGKGHTEEYEYLEAILANYRIPFDYISIIKSPNRRMATHREKFITESGVVYQKDKLVYMLTTNPHDRMGMARPIKISLLYGDTPMEQITKDVFKLSYMHIGALNKVRMPITIHYADLSSTFFNRGMLPTNSTKKALHFV